ncbi:hypothetical protein [Silvanigrella aquatica]|uniref:OmpA-like domain-containing protein n=1 Tax=Silvanigrella aquatica TaxID=1915309 RepID=A0A1L4D3J2_9BACT|nr:hypothetical protein [Silvanigrella aquatica]APJ04786.1 hypothetical protein AXG55_13115 [Silvanigrella aquatica]
MINKIFKNLYPFSSIILLLNWNSYASEEKQCILEFVTNSSVKIKNKNDFEFCINELQERGVEAIIAIGGTSASGTKNRNKQLAEERVDTASLFVNKIFPNTRIKKINAGSQAQIGEKVHVSFIMANEKTEAQNSILSKKIDELEWELQNIEALLAASEGEVLELQSREKIHEEKHLSDMKEKDKLKKINKPHFRIAPRFGYDSILNNDDSHYLSVGAEAAWTNRESTFRPELGGKIMTSLGKIENNKVPNVTNAYGFFGLGLSAKGFLSGARFLVGEEWIKNSAGDSKKNNLGMGGEVRLGYEMENGFSIIADYGLTKNIQMIGFNLGYIF